MHINFLYLVIIIVCTLILIYIYPNQIENLNYTNIDNINNGDLILFRWNKVGLLHEIISSFTHVGIVIDNQILETHLKGDTESYRGGVHLYNLKDRINKYLGTNYILKIKTPLTNEQVHKILNKLEEYKKIPFHDEYESHFKQVCVPKMVCKNCFNDTERKGMFCSEFVGFILKELSILPKDYNIHCLTPGSFVNMKNIFGDLYKIKKL